MTTIETGIKWDAVKRALAMEHWEDFDGIERRGIFLGTVFALLPSGKYYMPWSTNVTEDEARQDEAWMQQAEAEAAEHGFCLESGEGDPCDLFVVQYK